MKKISFLAFIGLLTASLIFPFPLFGETMRGIRVVSKKGNDLYLYKSYHAMVIGISDYEYWPKLPNATRDAKEVSEKLKKFGFETKLVLDPTYREMKTALNELIYKVGNEENRAIIFYYAGHGETEALADKTKMGYVIPKDCPLLRDDPMGFAAHAISMRDIESASLRIQSKHVLMLFDSCFSGSLFALTRAVPDDITEKSNLPVRQYITAGREDEQVPDKSMFKRSFLIGLDGDADLTGDGYVTGTELGMYLSDKVVNYTHRRQHPQYGKINNPDLDRGDFIFVSASPSQKPHKKESTDQPAKQEQPVVSTSPSTDSSLELAFWGTISNSNDIDMLKAYVAKFPNGTFVELAKIKIKKLSEEAAKKKEATVEPAPKGQEIASLKVPEVKVKKEMLSQKTGALMIFSNVKGASVGIKGRINDKGRTPYTKKGLKPGIYKIRVFDPNNSRRNYFKKLKLKAGRITQVNVNLRNNSAKYKFSDRSGSFTTPATVVISMLPTRSNIRGALVTLKQIGGAFFDEGRTPYRKTELTPDEYRITVSKGSKNYYKEIHLLPGSKTLIRVKLKGGFSAAKIEVSE